jgi:hypothetical protein
MGKSKREPVEEQVATLLKEHRLKFEKEPFIGGVSPDFLVRHPDGTVSVIEVKSWEPSPESVARAAEQAARYQKLTGAARAFVVLPSLPPQLIKPGVVGISELASVLLAQPRTSPEEKKKGRAKRRARKTTKTRISAPVIFVAMPFDEQYDDVFFVAVVPAAKDLNATCIRVDQEEFVGDIPSRIRKDIRRSSAVIVDLSGARPNVLYEAGFAHALGKPAVHICSTPIGQLPFDVSHNNTLVYSQGQTYRLKDKLLRRLEAVLT